MRILIKTTDENFVKLYLTLWRTALKLTESEVTVLEAIVKKYLVLQTEGVKDSYIPDLLFTTKVRKELQETVGYSENHFNNIVKTLKDKKIITKIGDSYMISDKRVIPVPELTFKFVQ